jgi:hypothetical protein
VIEAPVVAARPIVDTTLRVVASVLLASIVVAAWHDVSKAWDVWSYHLPFAGRIAGLVDPASYVFGRGNESRYDGFPLAAEAAQGLLWRIFGRIQAANLLSVGAIGALCIFLRRMFGVAWHLTFLALLAVPLVQIHATATYVDLPANACAAMLVLCACRAVITRDASPKLLAGAGVLAALTANAKFQLVPVVLAACAVLVFVAARAREGRGARLMVVLAFVPFVFATPLANFARHGNPVWPVALGPLPHLEGAYSSSPVWLENAPRPVRFLCSALELGLEPIASHGRWSIDQWTPPSHPGYRMGGYFGAYFAVNVAALVFAAWRRKDREVRVLAGAAAATCAVVSVLPQSHELRYYLVAMIVLVAANLAVWSRDKWAETSAVVVIALAIVAWSTSAHYLYASGDDFETLVANKTDARLIDSIEPGERVCVSRAPWTFLYAPQFHRPKRYTLQEAEDDVDCSGARKLE